MALDAKGCGVENVFNAACMQATTSDRGATAGAPPYWRLNSADFADLV